MTNKLVPKDRREDEFSSAFEREQSPPNPENFTQTSPASGAKITPSRHAVWRLPSLVFAIGIIGGAFLWSYWPTFNELVESWERIPDYSHGYFVIPLAIIFLWFRREQFPGAKRGLSWWGLMLMLLSIALRYVGAQFFLSGVDGWSILLWSAGAVWFLCGAAVLRWSLPSIVFLFFMIPLPYGMERWLSLPLQRIATLVSCAVLQFLGQPALAEGNTIWLNNINLEVEQACSGLRIFVGILALAYVYLVLVRRAWWERIILLLSVIPVALGANCARIVVTAFLYQYASGATAKRFTHDFAGWLMIPLAAGLFALVLWYVSSLFREEEEMDMRSLVRAEKSL
jgi:exosortase